MTRAVVWKEVREQWANAAAVTLLAGALLVSVTMLADSPTTGHEQGTVVVLCAAWVAGLVAGVQPLAGEAEGGTLGWLDGLPTTRCRLWRAKAGAAVALTAAQVVLLLGLAVGLGVHFPSAGFGPLMVVAFVSALAGLAAGLYGSAATATALGAFGWAIVTEFVLGIILAVVITPFSDVRTTAGRAARDVLIVAVVAAPLAASARRFTRLDRQRRRAETGPAGARSPWRAVAWLTWRQGKATLLFVLLAGAVIAVLVPPLAPDLWPPLGLLLGVTAGVGTFAADRGGSAYRLFGDRRFPPGSIWLTRQAARAAAPAAVVAVYCLSLWVHLAVARTDLHGYRQDRAVERLSGQADPSFVLFGPVFGYALGQFLGLVCRKPAVAAVLSVLTAAGVGLVWMPSLVIGGVHLWQWVVPPLLLILATRPAFWPWATDRLGTWRPAAGLTAAVVLAAAAIAGGIGYRAIEPPEHHDPFDVAAFQASLPRPEENAGGRAVAQALHRFNEQFDRVNPAVGDPRRPSGTVKFQAQVPDVVNAAEWPAGDLDFDAWLTAMFEGGWLDDLRAAVRLPPGSLRQTFGTIEPTEYRVHHDGFTVGRLLLARSLRESAAGRVAPALDDLALVLDIARHLQSKAPPFAYLNGASLELTAAGLLAPWAAKAVDRPDLSRRAIEMLRAHDAARPPLADAVKMEYLTALDYLNAPHAGGEEPNPIEADVYRAALQAPWEQTRSRRIVATLFAGVLRTAESNYPDAIRRIAAVRPPGEWWLLDAWTPPPGDEPAGRRASAKLHDLLRSSVGWHVPWNVGPHVFNTVGLAVTATRAAQVQLALVLHQRQAGKPAADLAELVPGILPELPADPFSGEPFRYRVSPGEEIAWNRWTPDAWAVRKVAAGQGIVWSVGPDLRDDGGATHLAIGWPVRYRTEATDLLYLVPPPK